MRIPTLPTLTAATALAATAVLGAATGATAADGDGDGDPSGTGNERGRGVVVQPTRVAPGGDFSVFDGGNCAAETGTASFVPPPGGTRLPDLRLEPLSNMIGAVSVLPEDAEPGYYKVTVECGDGAGPFTGSFTVTGSSRGGGDGDPRHEGGDAGTQPRGEAGPGPQADRRPTENRPEQDGHEQDRHEESGAGQDGRHERGAAEKDLRAGGSGHEPSAAAEARRGDGGHGDAEADHREDGVRDTGAAEPQAHHSPAPRGGVATGVGGGATSDTTAWGLGGAGVLALIGGALWYRRHGRA
ncbi:hypothetical protein GCM10023347_05410 [Streptomyces chumphonensis]|uniref:LPXTG cell wall anchor domain-containing protein n=1 Tax=Streptomyces chumphonensis TaxID=1214925 RepID=A0A927F1A1_9ACTN|nr:hypothetical protein [Streptomyces chumphonensis]MBD3933170.1 hypothetical protein [Streptomyces chumphonensis]